jgi:hypothetical protein
LKTAFFLGLLIFITIASCKNEKGNKDAVFPFEPGNMLAFDLSNSTFECKLFVGPNKTSKDFQFLLPFQITEIKNNIELLSTVGSYDKFSVVRCKTAPTNLANVISFNAEIPTFTRITDNTSLDRESGVYLLEDGLERLFVYDYNFIKNNGDQLGVSNVKNDVLDFIAVKIPSSATGKEIKNGKTTFPDPIFSNYNVKVFTGLAQADKLQVRYQLDSEAITKKKGFYLIIKGVILLIVPLIELVLLSLVNNPTAKKRWGIGFITLECLLVGLMVWLSFKGEFIGIDLAIDNLSSVIVALVMSIIIFKRA